VDGRVVSSDVYHSKEVLVFVENIRIATEVKFPFSLYMSWMRVGEWRYSCTYS
jgi:hypothetical protein